jgi:hypothetical protein
MTNATKPSSVITEELLRTSLKLPLVDYQGGPDARSALGIGARRAYELANSGELPTIRLGRQFWVTTAVLRRLLDMDAA